MKSIWDYLQDRHIDRSSVTADQAQAKTYDLDRRVKDLEAEVDALTLILMAMWELLGKSEGFFLKDLEAKMQEIDLRDGKLDGGASLRPSSCKSCGRSVAGRRRTCIYCGKPLLK